jgi:membrane glycosyltransferase
MREAGAIRLSFTGLVLVTVAAAATSLWSILRVDGITPLETLFLASFVALCIRNSASFWMACAGAYALLSKRFGALHWPQDGDDALCAGRARTAIVMPICDEDAERVFAGLAAMHDSLRDIGADHRFEFFILSDTRDERRRGAELRQCGRMRDEGRTSVHYRHRVDNRGRKSGNIAEFCENWGALFDYMVVLDADSLMTGRTLAKLVQLMDRNPLAALIQVPPLLVGRNSLFARLQQFAASVYGPLFSAGFALIHGANGNYWGHNAIIRVAPFMRHCGLPKLPGRAPLGGEILSHDFVEAALLRRAGWELHMAPQLGGSFEEPPPTLMDYLKRDRRWCQGNLQHVRLVFAQGFRWPSRMHLLAGVMTYLSAPLWVLMIALSAAGSHMTNAVKAVSYVGRYPVLAWPVSHAAQFGLLILTLVGLLFGPKVIALFMLMRDRDACRAHGGRFRAALSVVFESVFSVLFAPIAMLSHCWFLISIFSGHAIGWGRQTRRDYRPSSLAILRTFAPHTLIAIFGAILLREFLPESFWWFAPLLIGAVLAVPLAYGTSSLRLGRWTRRLGLLLVPSETREIEVVRRSRTTAAQSLNAA